MQVARWFWALLVLWCIGYAAVSLLPGSLNLRTPIFLAFTFLAVNPLIGIPAVLVLSAPFIAIPFALRRPNLSQEK